MPGEFTDQDRAMLGEVHDAMIRFAEYRSGHDKDHYVIDKRLDDHTTNLKQLSVRWYGIVGSLATALAVLGYLFYEVLHGSR